MPVAPEPDLPGTVTSISTQKNNKQRYSLFVDDTFLMGVAEHTLLKFKIRKGKSITPGLYQKLQREEGFFKVKSYCLRRLGARAHSRRELFTKAIKKDFPKQVINQALDDLEQKGLLDDEDFAQKFAADKFNLNQWGPTKIKAHLYKKGISNRIAEQSIAEVFQHQDFRETFLTLVKKKKRRFLREKNELKRKKKIVDHLARKGYRSSDIFKHIDELLEAVKS